MMIKCPNCSAETEYIAGESDFCSNCGRELAPGTPAAAEFAANGSQKSSANIPDTGFPGVRQAQDDSWELAKRSREIADNIENIDIDDFRSSCCPYLKVEYNRNRRFLTNSASVIDLRMTPLNDQLKELLIYFTTESNGKKETMEIPVKEKWTANRPFRLLQNFRPLNYGNMVMNFYVGCKVNGDYVYYTFTVEQCVYNSQNSTPQMPTPSITINQQISAQHAADINYRDSIGSALQEMAAKNRSVNEMIDMNDLPPNYVLQHLTKTSWSPEEVLIHGTPYPTAKLLLEYKGKSIFLVNQSAVKFGRFAETSDIVVRCGQGKLSSRDYPNSTISRKHAEIVYCDDSVKFINHSSYGTYINDRKVEGDGVVLKNGSALVEFGDIKWQINIQKCDSRRNHNICKVCAAKKVKSLTFTRSSDNEPEFYLLIWQCCELGKVIEELTDWTIFAKNGCFFIRTPEQKFYYLKPGATIASQNSEIKVKLFKWN